MADDLVDDYSPDDAARDIAAIMAAPQQAPQVEDDGIDGAPQAQATAAPEAPAAPEQPTAAAPQPAPEAPKPAAPQATPQPQAPETNAVKTELEKTLSFARVLTGQLQQQLMGEFADITSEADVYKLMENPERYNRFAIAVAKVQAANSQVGQLEQQQKQAGEVAKQQAEGERMKARAEVSKKIGEMIPDLLKPEVAPKLQADLTAYARKNDIPPARYLDATAGEVSILYKAMLHDAREASEAAALETASRKAANAPPVQRPGTVRNPASAKEEKAQESYEAFTKSGRVDDLASFLQRANI